jgi:hypothetical protein
LSWRIAGEEETGLTLQGAAGFSAADIKAVIRKTRLYDALAQRLRD